MACDWCGHEHDQLELCSQRPSLKVGRRSFLGSLGALAYAVTHPPTLAAATQPLAYIGHQWGHGQSHATMTSFDAALKKYYLPLIKKEMERNTILFDKLHQPEVLLHPVKIRTTPVSWPRWHDEVDPDW